MMIITLFEMQLVKYISLYYLDITKYICYIVGKGIKSFDTLGVTTIGGESNMEEAKHNINKKNQRRILIHIILVICIGLLLSGCCVFHDWQDATCETPKTCSKCQEKEGEALGHDWVEASCSAPKNCTRCGATEGVSLWHKYERTECGKPEVCSICGHEGTPSQHNASPATCTEDSVCTLCNEVVEKATGHKWSDATVRRPRTCYECDATEGDVLPPSYFDMSFTEFKKAFSKNTNGAMEIKTGSHGFALNIPSVGISEKGKRHIIVFNEDVFAEKGPGAHAGSTDELKQFNKLVVRYITPTKINDDDMLVIILTEAQIGKTLDPDFDNDEFTSSISSGHMSDTSAHLHYSAHGFDYDLNCTDESWGSNTSFWYELTVTLKANSW